MQCLSFVVQFASDEELRTDEEGSFVTSVGSLALLVALPWRCAALPPPMVWKTATAAAYILSATVQLAYALNKEGGIVQRGARRVPERPLEEVQRGPGSASRILV